MIGPSYKILPAKEFSNDYKKLASYFQKIIRDKIEDVAQNPARYKHLHYELSGSCRIRIGKLRIIYSYDDNKKELYLEKIVFEHRYR